MAREPGRLGCALESVNRNEPLLATASRVRRWLLVEQPGAWGREALLESRLEATVARALHSRARRAGVRVVLIRRPGRNAPDGHRAFLVRSDREVRWIEQIHVAKSEALLDIDLSLTAGDQRPGIGEEGPSSVQLVCTNGRHDACCADLGRPVVRALSEAEVPEVWECSHVGGDRFAANLVFLPTGVYYGRVPPEDAARLVREHGEGLLDLDHYRGRSCYPPWAQAGEIFARRQLDERRLDGLTLVALRQEHDDTAALEFSRGGETVEVRVGREAASAERLTCADHGVSRAWQYRLLSLR